MYPEPVLAVEAHWVGISWQQHGPSMMSRSRASLLAVLLAVTFATFQRPRCNVSAWSPWSHCSASCGTGTQDRWRRPTSKGPCPALSQSRLCGTPPCAVPTASPTPQPTAAPTAQPTATPTAQPTRTPTPAPSPLTGCTLSAEDQFVCHYKGGCCQPLLERGRRSVCDRGPCVCPVVTLTATSGATLPDALMSVLGDYALQLPAAVHSHSSRTSPTHAHVPWFE